MIIPFTGIRLCSPGTDCSTILQQYIHESRSGFPVIFLQGGIWQLLTPSISLIKLDRDVIQQLLTPCMSPDMYIGIYKTVDFGIFPVMIKAG
jgi:hypothetical protein